MLFLALPEMPEGALIGHLSGCLWQQLAGTIHWVCAYTEAFLTFLALQLANGADGKYEEALAIAEGAKGLAMLHLLQEKRLQPELQLTEFDPKVPMATLHQLQVALKHSGAALAVEYVIAADVLLTFTMDCDGQVMLMCKSVLSMQLLGKAKNFSDSRVQGS